MPKIMIVDDCEEILLMLRVLLTTHGYEVVEARNGSEAFDRALISPPDLIVTDIVMPIMGGYELIASLKRNTMTMGIPILIVAAFPHKDSDAEVSLPKPVHPELFLRYVARLLNPGMPTAHLGLSLS